MSSSLLQQVDAYQPSALKHIMKALKTNAAALGIAFAGLVCLNTGSPILAIAFVATGLLLATIGARKSLPSV